MTRPRRQPAFDMETPQQQVTPEPVPVDPADTAIDEVFAKFPQHEACLELWRTTEKGGRPVFVEDISPAEFGFGYVAREWGGGKYLIKGTYKGGTPVSRSFEIGGDPFPIKRKVPQGNPVPQAPVAPSAAPLITMTKREDGSYDMGEVVSGMFGMMQKMMLESRASEDQVLDKMMKYKALFGGGEYTKPQSTVQEAIGMIKTGIELAQAGGSGGESGFPWMMALDKLQGPLTELVSTIKVAVTQGKAGALPVPNSIAPPSAQPGQPAQPAQPAQPEPTNMEMILKSAVNHVLPNLVTGAAKDADPAFYSDFLLDQIPARFYATAKDWLSKPDILDQLKAMNPAVAQYEIWFGQLRAELVKELSEELGEDAARTVQPQPASEPTADSSADI